MIWFTDTWLQFMRAKQKTTVDEDHEAKKVFLPNRSMKYLR